MSEDTKVAAKRRLAEALRANLRRRKDAAARAAQVAATPDAVRPGSTHEIADGDNQG